MNNNVWIYILCMAAVTFLIRVIPLTLIRKPINNRFLRSFLYYVPYTVLSVMTFPAILFATSSMISAAVGTAVALLLAFMRRSLLTVAAGSAASVLITELILTLI